MPTFFKRFLIASSAVIVAALLSILGIIGYVQLSLIDAIYPDIADISEAPYAIILGASVKSNGKPSDVLYDRIYLGSELIKSGKVETLLMTGDGGAYHINEVAAMKRVAMELGVDEQDIIVDGQGYRTYESCKRANQIYDIRKAIVVTQRFHLARSLYLCDFFGIEVQGLAADRQHYQRDLFFLTRDLISSAKAWWDTQIQAPMPPV